MAKIHDINFATLEDSVESAALTFARNSVARIPSTGAEAAVNTARIEPVTVASPVEVTKTAGKFLIGKIDAYLYAVDSTSLYRSINNKNWSLVHTFAHTIHSGFVTSAGTLLVATQQGTNKGKLWRFNGTSWVEVLEAVADGTRFVNFSWSHEVAGHIFLAEYASKLTGGDNARHVFMTNDDGRTWTTIHAPDNVEGKHAHNVCAAIYDNQILCFVTYGDGAFSDIVRLTPGSPVWTAETVVGSMPEQPTSSIWLPEENKILWGNDGSGSSGSIFEQDLSEGLTPTFNILFNGARQFFDPHINSPTGGTISQSNANFFNMVKVGGAYFASMQDNRYGLVASADGENWTVLYSDGVMTGRTIITHNGSLYWSDYSPRAVYSCQLPQFLATTGVLIERASLQTCSDAILAAFYDDAPVDGETPLSVVTNAPEGDLGRSNVLVRWQSADGQSQTAPNRLRNTAQSVARANFAVNDPVVLSFYAKGRISRTGTKNQRFLLHIDARQNGGDYVTQQRYSYPDDNWRRFIVAVKASGTHTAPRIQHQLTLVANAAGFTYDLYIADWMVESHVKCPASFHFRTAGDRAQEVLSYAVDYGSTFTDAFTFVPTFDSDYLLGKAATDYIFVKSYIEDADNWMAVVLNAYSKKLQLISNAGVVAESAALEFYENTPLHVAVVRDGTTATLHVWTPQGYKADSGEIPDLTLALVRYGCDAAATAGNGGSFIFVQNATYDEAMSIAGVKTAMQQPAALPALPAAASSGGVGIPTLYGSGGMYG